MTSIRIEHQPGDEPLKSLGVSCWPIWEHDTAVFPWTYDELEVCYLLEGEVLVTLEDGSQVRFERGDLVTFPAGLSCTWNILRKVKKHFTDA